MRGIVMSFLPTPSARRATIICVNMCICVYVFLPTPSARRATVSGLSSRQHGVISTHALREEGDSTCYNITIPPEISTHALREEGDPNQSYFLTSNPFISTHALREEGDVGSGNSALSTCDFYPRPPRGGRPDSRQVKYIV